MWASSVLTYFAAPCVSRRPLLSPEASFLSRFFFFFFPPAAVAPFLFLLGVEGAEKQPVVTVS